MNPLKRNALKLKTRNWTICSLALFLLPAVASAQAKYTATGPGSYLQLGVTFSAFHSQYGDRLIAGPSAFLDAHLYRRLGLEAEARDLNVHTDEGVRQQTYLIGPKLTILPHRFRPFVKLLAGRGEFRFPYGYAQGSYLVLAPGAGVDYRLGESRWSLRVVDVEYQDWHHFTFGKLRNLGASTGITYRIR